MVTKREFYERAREYVGTPFRHQGRTPGRALDCVGLPSCVAQSFGLEVKDSADYREYADWTLFVKNFRANGDWIGDKESVAEPGMIVILRDGEARRVHQTHCAVVAERNGEKTLIHAYKIRGQVVEERFTVAWARRVTAVFNLYGVE